MHTSETTRPRPAAPAARLRLVCACACALIGLELTASLPEAAAQLAPLRAASPVDARPTVQLQLRSVEIPPTLDPEDVPQEAAGPQLEPVVGEAGGRAPRDSTPLHVPLGGGAPAETPRVEISARQGRISLTARAAPLEHVLGLLAQETGLNIVTGDDMNRQISLTLRDVMVEDALTAMLAVVDCSWTRHKDIIHVTTNARAKSLPPALQGRELRVLTLDYASATETLESVQALLSPSGQAFVRAIRPGDARQSGEALVVEDLPAYVDRVAAYIAQIDVPPRQVVIEARILQVDLNDDNKHGVNFQQLSRMSGDGVTLSMNGFANQAAPQAFTLSLSGGKLTGLLECLQQTTDAKTLAAPQVIALNGQEAKIQIGEQLGFRVTTTTQTSSLESVEFLDVGVVLSVTPYITRDHRVLMHVKPEVSSGLVNATTGLPEEATTELETNVLVNDGEGLVIGGLIQEENSDVQSKLPKLGDAWMVGRLFQRREARKRRSEIIVAMIPRIVHPEVPAVTPECGGPRLERATTPLFQGPLHVPHRPWEPALHDAVSHPRPLAPAIGRCGPNGACPPRPAASAPLQIVEPGVKTVEPICFFDRVTPLSLPGPQNATTTQPPPAPAAPAPPQQRGHAPRLLAPKSFR